MKSPSPPEPSMVELTPEEWARLWGLPDEDGYVISGSLIRVPAAKVREWETRTGSLDVTFADISLVTRIPLRTLHGWRNRGVLKVRVFGTSLTQGLRVAPAELILVLRKFAADRNGTTERVETPAQLRKRAAQSRIDAMIACGWKGDVDPLSDPNSPASRALRRSGTPRPRSSPGG